MGMEVGVMEGQEAPITVVMALLILAVAEGEVVVQALLLMVTVEQVEKGL
jgi:hypothetical protein